MGLAFDQQRIDDRAEVVDRRCISPPRRRRCRGRLRPRRHGSRWGRSRHGFGDVADIERGGEPSGSSRPRRTRSASSMMPTARSVPAMTKRPSPESMSPADASSTCAARSLPLAMTLSAACSTAVPDSMVEREPPVPPPCTSWSLSPCSSRILSNGTPSLSVRICANGRGVSLAVIERAGDDRHRAVILEADAAHFLGAGGVVSR